MATTAARRGCVSALRRLAAARFSARAFPPVSRTASASAGRAFRSAPSWALASSDASTSPADVAVAASNGTDLADAARRFCIVGSGPAGMYAADRLLAHYGDAARVDVLERLPTPFGLVRSGVAPDHAGTKSVTNRFDGILADPRVSFFGNVELGRDVSVAELVPRCDTPRVRVPRTTRRANRILRTVPVVRDRSLTFFSLPRYDGTILAYGCDGDRTLDVPGEALSGVLSAREFVGWFNGDPRSSRRRTRLSRPPSRTREETPP